MLFTISGIFLYKTGPIQWMFSQHCGCWWPGALATVLTTHPCVSRCLRVNHAFHIHWQTRSKNLLLIWYMVSRKMADIFRFILKCIYFTKVFWIEFIFSIKYISMSSIKIGEHWFGWRARRQVGDNPLPESMMIWWSRSWMDMCVTEGEWVNRCLI